MEIVGILNIASFLLILTAVIVLLSKLFSFGRNDNTLIFIIISFCVLLLVTLTNLFEHLHITNYFDLFEDELEILFLPLFIFAAFSYCLKKELQANKKNQESIKEKNLRLYTSMEGSKEALWEWYPGENILAINKSYCYLDFEPIVYTITDLNWREIIHPNSEETFKILVSAIKSNSELPENSELQVRSSDGKYQWVMIRGKKTTLNFENADITYLGSILEIGIFKQIQFDLIRAREKAEISEKLKTAFLQNISHEIRTPMNAIIGFSDLIIDPCLTPDKQQKYTQLIVQGCERLLQIVEDLVEMSQIVAHAVTVNLSRVHSKNVIQKLLDFYSSKAISKNLVLECTAYPDFIFISDEQKLLRILFNLLDNSVKFTSYGKIEFGMILEGDDIHFFVIDTGIGIEEKFQRSIFNYFQQAELSNTRFYGGSGLGLSICKGLIDTLGGKIQIESELGKGTSVYFSVPYRCPEESNL
jgi:signal transduction histidine kinase